ncbi:PadR family transcriptional regulator [Intrasporangium chromatireducens Q5-1]|uniref:PadR family transcriptional regulator n=2 Tax=Intrasporangium TaxID=53357 RepID=W9GHK4_9MICO|nr:PadR family transcriptional regulator [Intrasporangium chromatireducens Q5-1]
MQEPTFLVLTALAGGPRHGYAVMREVTAASEGRVRLRAGTLYAALERLEAEGLVRACDSEVVDGRRRRYYELTDQGAARLAEEAARAAANAARAKRALAARTARAARTVTA